MTKRNKIRDWEEYYRDQEVEEMPWFQMQLDHDFEAALKKYNITSGRALDVGSGPGTQSSALAEHGLHVTATDVSQSAIEKAQTRYKDSNITFRQDDILKSEIRDSFDYIFDRGCFHSIDPPDRRTYAINVARLLKPDATLFLKCFSYKEPGDEGPYRLTPDEIRETFSELFCIESIKDSFFHSSQRGPVRQALFCVLKRKEKE